MKPLKVDVALFDRLAARRGARLASIFIPTHSRGREVAQGPIRLKNRLSKLDSVLESLGLNTGERRDRLAEATQLLDDREFWEHQSAGLGLYVDQDGVTTPVSIPVWVDADVFVGGVFHLRHLLPSIGLASVPILVLTKKSVRLFEGSKLEMSELEADLPRSFEDVNWFVDREKQRQQRPDRAGIARGHHGHELAARAEEDRDRFLRAVGDALPPDVRNQPIVVLGDDILVSRFRTVANLETISPNSSGVSNTESDAHIHDLARPAIVELETASEAKTLDEALSRLSLGKATTSVREALPAARSGRLSRVVVERGATPIWGRFDASDLTVDVHEHLRPGDVDLIDRVVVEARATGATVTTVGVDVEGDSLLAVFRY